MTLSIMQTLPHLALCCAFVSARGETTVTALSGVGAVTGLLDGGILDSP